MALSYQEIRARCLKPDEASKPIYARFVTHALSTRFIWLVQGAPFSPNQLTLVSLVLAFAALPFFATLSPSSVLIGAVLTELYYVFDAVDGQWARLTGKKSLTGAFFDYLINYAMQPPLLFAIGWGVYHRTGEPAQLLLGFMAGFSTLWVILIWNLRASVLLSHLAHVKKAPAKLGSSPENGTKSHVSPLRAIFSWAHKLMVFPWFMYVLTASSVLCFAADRFAARDLTLPVFGSLLTVYGLGGTAIAFLLAAYWILAKKIDAAPELN